MIDGNAFTTVPKKNLAELPQDLQPRNTAEKQNESVFYLPHVCFIIVMYNVVNLHHQIVTISIQYLHLHLHLLNLL